MTGRNEWNAIEGETDTVLIFGEVTPGQNPPFAIAHFGQDAYEMYQIAIYTKELVRVRSTDYLCWAPGFNVLAAVAMDLLKSHDRLIVEDFGSTLFSTVDKLEKIFLHKGQDNFHKIEFRGIETSDVLSDIAVNLHQGKTLTHYKRWQDIDSVEDAPVILRSYQATSYGFTSTQELAEWLCRGDFSLQGLWVSAVPGERSVSWSGKRLHFFDFRDLKARLNDKGLDVAVISSDVNRVRGETYISVWFITYNPIRVCTETLRTHFHTDTGMILAEARDHDPLIQSEAKGHPTGKSLIYSETAHRNPTFNFGADNLLDTYNEFRGRE